MPIVVDIQLLKHAASAFSSDEGIDVLLVREIGRRPLLFQPNTQINIPRNIFHRLKFLFDYRFFIVIRLLVHVRFLGHSINQDLSTCLSHNFTGLLLQEHSLCRSRMNGHLFHFS